MNDKIILRPKEDSSVTFSIRVNKDLVEKYDDLANKSGYSRNELINRAMESYINSVKFVPNESSIESIFDEPNECEVSSLKPNKVKKIKKTSKK